MTSPQWQRGSASGPVKRQKTDSSGSEQSLPAFGGSPRGSQPLGFAPRSQTGPRRPPLSDIPSPSSPPGGRGHRSLGAPGYPRALPESPGFNVNHSSYLSSRGSNQPGPSRSHQQISDARFPRPRPPGGGGRARAAGARGARAAGAGRARGGGGGRAD